MSRSLDPLDIEIIFGLQQDGRRSNAELAHELGVSEATIRRRIERLRQEQVIQITAVPDPYKTGYNTVAHVGLQVQMGKLYAVAEALAAKPCVHYVGLTTGRYDILFWVALRSPVELAKFLTEDLPQIDGIVRTETMVNLKMFKRSFGWLCRPSESP